MLRAARAKFSLTASPSITSTDDQPSALKLFASLAVLPSASSALSSTISLPSACLVDSAVLSASLRTFLGRSCAWLRGVGPKITAPLRHCGEREIGRAHV